LLLRFYPLFISTSGIGVRIFSQTGQVRYYTLFDEGILTCHDAKTGREIYGKQRVAAAGFTGSPWAYNDRIFCLSEDGDTYVVQAGDTFKLLAQNSLDDTCLATPAIADGSLILRTLTRLYRIENS
jgi:outer membrane protein assembly factor BamB